MADVAMCWTGVLWLASWSGDIRLITCTLGWTGTLFLWARGSNFTTPLGLLIISSDKQRQKGKNATNRWLCLAFMWKGEETEQERIMNLSQGTDDLPKRCLYLVQSSLEEKSGEPLLSASSFQSVFKELNNIPEKQILFTKRKYQILQDSHRQLNCNPRHRISLLSVKPKHRAYEVQEWFHH